MSKVLTHSTKSYIKIFFVGILVGCICRLADYFPADTLWSFSRAHVGNHVGCQTGGKPQVLFSHATFFQGVP